MGFGSSMFRARKKSGLSQEDVAEKLGVSRQTVSKWETDETVPDIYQAKKLAVMYGVTLDELADFDVEVKEIEAVIEKTSEETQRKIDWTKMWSKKYPVLNTYQDQVTDKEFYAEELGVLLDRLKRDYGYNNTDALLVLKDILARVWNKR